MASTQIDAIQKFQKRFCFERDIKIDHKRSPPFQPDYIMQDMGVQI
ncbi:hypothetical protein SUBVAR_05820 [Subdoligranulum variabile DSM 15176]|uniref:Uncharacterized protein n=1 Tax=Subdoligranulum variabile DSM 15176 TaxID=411471 RepID=D1PNA1_9FIRM|nr:hypothetical protein SUBVAR_05820 [Subdoligranulum variabile DSM 15176]